MRTAVLSREEKGRLIAEKPNQIQRMDERFYKVASQSSGKMYDVIRRENDSWICTCFDFQYRGVQEHKILRCKHIIAVQISLEDKKKVRENVIIAPIEVDSCLFCHGKNLKKFGVRHNKYGDLQRFLCARLPANFHHELRFRANEA